MAKDFLNHEFLLETGEAVKIYEEYASKMPIIDFHNHLSPKDIFNNRKFNNLTELWLDGDHYKWRAMRANGIEEKYCTGNASPFEKFMKWAETMPYTLRNPLYHWSHMELRRYFGVTELLNKDSAEKIYATCNELLQQEEFRVSGLLAKMKVEIICTTDDPTDSLEYHRQFAAQKSSLKMFPTFRPDKIYKIDNPTLFNDYLNLLTEASSISINTFDDLMEALKNRVNFFHDHGCRASDYGLETLCHENNDSHKVEDIFFKLRGGKSLLVEEKPIFRSRLQVELSKLYHAKGWVQQFHLGAIRNNNTRKLNELGPDTGFDSIGEFSQISVMQKLFDHLDTSNQLTKTIVYNLNPSDNELFITMASNFNDGSVAGKMQLGSGWWFLDQKDGIEKQLNTLSNMGLLSRFVGMVTDSRSFLSFPRHEYFRRILCNLIGNDIAKGELPNDLPWLGKIVQDICYHNAKKYFNF